MAIHNQKWRLNNLYRIIDKDSNDIKFRLNPIQENVLNNLHNRNLILKARQLGMSTFAVLYMLDETLFNNNLMAGIVSYTRDHAQHIFRKIIGHALDTLLPVYQPYVNIIRRTATEVCFSNGSSLRVDTTLRGSAYPLVLVSEFGKTCARNPLKAEEVITGTLQAVPKNGRTIIESTGEGSDGFFAEMCMEAHRKGNENLSSLSYKLFFFPWMDDPSYILEENVQIDVFLSDYFKGVEKQTGRILTQPQKNWYAMQKILLGDKIKQEYPSTVSEAFLATSDAFYFAEAIAQAHKDNRCLQSSLFDALLPLYVSMDIGVNDLTVIIFFQVAHGEIRILDYYEDKNKDVDFYCKFLLQDKNYLYHTIFLPHDSKKRDPLDVQNTYERDFKRLFQNRNTRIMALERKDKQLSISHARIMMNRCVFNINKTKKLLDNLSKYRKKWSEGLGKYLEEPLHNEASNYADAFQYVCQAVAHLETVSSMSGALEKHRKVVENRIKRF